MSIIDNHILYKFNDYINYIHFFLGKAVTNVASIPQWLDPLSHLINPASPQALFQVLATNQ